MSIAFGGPGYKWLGHNIRSLDNAVALPRSDSYIQMPVWISPNYHYELVIRGRNKGGNGRVEITCKGCKPQVLYIKSENFADHRTRIHTDGLDDEIKSELIIMRSKDCSGNILIESVSYQEIKIPAPIIESELDITKEKLLKQKKIGELQADRSKQERATKTQDILVSRGYAVAKPIIIGGNGYRWRGRAVRVLQKQNFTLVNMLRKDSIIMAPINISSGVKYKLVVTAANNGGNGALLFNFFGGKNYDGQSVPVNIINTEMSEYAITVQAPKFPNNLPVYLRIWRPNDAIGNVTIKTIQCASIDPGIPRASQLFPKLRPQKGKRIPKLPIVPTDKNEKVAPKSTEDTTMKFKPYELRKGTEAVYKVLVSKPEDVPRVSIITPTRDGLELLKKCYAALDKNTDYPNWEWIVGDSCSTDGTEEWFKTLNDARVKFIQRGTTEGSFSSINNELTLRATGEYYLFLNNDTEPQPFWLYEMVSKIHHNPKIGIVGAKLLYSPEKIQHAGIAFIPQGPANIGKSVLGSFPVGFADKDRFYQAVTGACLLIRAEDFKAVDGFDPIYYFCYEDVDLCLKVGKKLNKKVLYAANATLLHAESITQKKHKTAGEKQQIGIRAFKERWMHEVYIDFPKMQKNNNFEVYPVDISIVTCVNNLTQYRNYIMGSLFKNNTTKNYELIPVLNFGNPYSASQALNIGINKAKSNIVVLCHQDVIFYENWLEMLFERIKEVENITPKWGVLGTAGITKRDDTVGVVHSMKGTLHWQSNKRTRVYEVQTVDEHCMIIRKNSGLRFDEKNFNGFHFYGPDICLNALSSGMRNFGILCPLVHDSSSSSLASGKAEFMRLLYSLARKWRGKFDFIRTPTSIIRKKSIRTFVRFKS